MKLWTALFGVLGLASFVFILHGYGFDRLSDDLARLGWWGVPLAFSFLPTVFLYALAWLLVTPELPFSGLSWLTRLTMSSVAWNNLSPFLKVLGEPVRLRLLCRRLDSKAAARSLVLYNIVHMLGTLASFFLGSLLILVLFHPSVGLRGGLLVFLVASPTAIAALYFLPHLARRRFGRRARRNRLWMAGFWLRWSASKVRVFSLRYPSRFWAAVLVEMTARFVEGITFYAAFRALGEIVPLGSCALLDVGRALGDNLFFFVPYQVGSREGGILLIARDALAIQSPNLIGAAVLYRLVEIFWTGIGYLLWIQDTNADKVST